MERTAAATGVAMELSHSFRVQGFGGESATCKPVQRRHDCNKGLPGMLLRLCMLPRSRTTFVPPQRNTANLEGRKQPIIVISCLETQARPATTRSGCIGTGDDGGLLATVTTKPATVFRLNGSKHSSALSLIARATTLSNGLTGSVVSLRLQWQPRHDWIAGELDSRSHGRDRGALERD